MGWQFSADRRAAMVGATGFALVGLAAALAPGRARADGLRYFRIGTGGVAGAYFPIGSILADALNGPGACPSENCRLDGMVAVAELSSGSVTNFESLCAGRLEAGLIQSDVFYHGLKGENEFRDKGPRDGARLLANLFTESVHLAVPQDSAIRTFGDIVGKRVSLGEPGSGTLVLARALLDAFGIGEADFTPEYVKPDLAVERIRRGRLDGFLAATGWPNGAVAQYAFRNDIRLVPIVGPEVQTLLARSPFLSAGAVPAGTYRGVPETPTIDVTAQLAVATALPDDLVYAVTKRLWAPETLYRLQTGHPKGGHIGPATALGNGTGPFHPGALRYYRETGLAL
jgi:TRAP transporter TAXI family solute receptor